jgi:hypothetical protein
MVEIESEKPLLLHWGHSGSVQFLLNMQDKHGQESNWVEVHRILMMVLCFNLIPCHANEGVSTNAGRKAIGDTIVAFTASESISRF